MDGDALAAALTSGIHRVLAKQELLNRINVFPVADSDTGTNLSLTLGSALGPLSNPGEMHLGTMLAAVAENPDSIRIPRPTNRILPESNP